MIVQLHQIGENFSPFDFTLNIDGFTKLEKRFSFEEMVCHAELKKDMDNVFLHGNFRVPLKANCDFCLSPTTLEIEEEFELKLVPEHSEMIPEGDLEIPSDGVDTDYYQGQEIDLGKVFEDQLVLELPLSIRCSETCKGVCSSCGVNLNETSCKCDEEAKDNPFSILKDLNI